MAYSCIEQIELKEKEIIKVKKILAKKYESLGKNVAFFVKDKSFNYCQNELSNYEISKSKYEQLLNKKQQLKSKVALIADCESDIFSLNEVLLEKKDEEKKELSKFGAVVYEAYCNGKFNKEISANLEDIFDNVNLKMQKYSKFRDKSNLILFIAHYERLIKKLQTSLPKLFIKAALYIYENNLEENLDLKNKEKYFDSLKEIIINVKNLETRIKECEDKIAEIRKEDSEPPSRKIEEMKAEFESAKDDSINSARLLGIELYQKLPDEITSDEIGKKSISLIDDITLELAKIDSLEQDIQKLNNEIFISELSAQIAHERTKIDQLEQEIKNCNTQIAKIEAIINKKRDTIIELKKFGTYEESTLNLKPLDDKNGNT
ncbi:MAG: coiled-coil domain-containing protein [Pleomorphochaeta sp.]